jgi:predicted P-loop ATPase
MTTSGDVEFEREVGLAKRRHYLRSLKWDGVFWIDGFAARGFGHPVKAAEALWEFLLGAVRRVMESGYRVDRALVLAGPGDVGKSQLLKLLAGDGYATCSVNDSGVRLCLDRHTPWLLDLPCDRRDLRSDAAKSVIDSVADNVSGKLRPRSFLPVFTTNESLSFDDFATSRRFYVLPVTSSLRLDGPDLRDRLWAEAYARYESESR